MIDKKYQCILFLKFLYFHKKTYICPVQTINMMDSTQILIKIRKIVRSISLESKHIQKIYGISIPQLLCLHFLKESKNFQATHKSIATYLELNSSTVTGIINRLQKKGYVARLPKREDKRTTYISLTSQGEKMLHDSPELLHIRLTDKLDQLDPAEVKTISESLEIIINLLDIESLDASPVIAADDFKTSNDKSTDK